MNALRALAAGLLAAGLGACSRPEAPPAQWPALDALVARCRAAAQAAPRDARLRAELALAFEANGRWTEAAEAYAQAAELDPGEPLWALHAAICETEAGRLDAAQRRLEAAAARFPAHAALVQRLGIAQLESGELERASATFLALARLEQGAHHGRVGAAEAQLARGDAAAALALAEEALQGDGTDGLARFLRGRALAELGRDEESARELAAAGVARRRLIGDVWSERAFEFTVGFEARFDRASSLLEGGRAREAAALLQALARERPEDARVFGNLAMAQAAANELGAALESCAAALALAPDSPELHAAHARVLLGAGRSADALAAARRAASLAPRRAAMLEVLALALLSTGEREAAEEVLRELSRLDPSRRAQLKLEGLGQ